jgi:hypothetical protein
VPVGAAVEAARYEISRWKRERPRQHRLSRRVDRHYYSVPHALVGTVVELRVTDALVECRGWF